MVINDSLEELYGFNKQIFTLLRFNNLTSSSGVIHGLKHVCCSVRAVECVMFSHRCSWLWHTCSTVHCNNESAGRHAGFNTGFITSSSESTSGSGDRLLFGYYIHVFMRGIPHIDRRSRYLLMRGHDNWWWLIRSQQMTSVPA